MNKCNDGFSFFPLLFSNKIRCHQGKYYSKTVTSYVNKISLVTVEIKSTSRSKPFLVLAITKYRNFHSTNYNYNQSTTEGINSKESFHENHFRQT